MKLNFLIGKNFKLVAIILFMISVVNSQVYYPESKAISTDFIHNYSNEIFYKAFYFGTGSALSDPLNGIIVNPYKDVKEKLIILNSV